MEATDNLSSLEDMIEEAGRILKKWKHDRPVFLKPDGTWGDHPSGIRDRISNEIFFRLWNVSEPERYALLRSTLLPFLQKDNRPLVAKIHRMVEKQSGLTLKNGPGATFEKRGGTPCGRNKRFFLVMAFNALTWFLQYETLRAGKNIAVSDWDREGKLYKKEVTERFNTEDEQIKCFFPEKESSRIYFFLTEWRKTVPDVLTDIPHLIVEEYRIFHSIHHLLEKAEERSHREEKYELILEKLHPPAGIADQTHPALLFPCIHLLLHPSIEISSGIHYQSSVILSILQDPRSTLSLLTALKKLPVQYTKIRENIIYTLGCLKEPRAVPLISEVLTYPDIVVHEEEDTKQTYLLTEQKAEGFWALSRIGLPSLETLSLLTKYTGHESEKIRTYLAWTLGELGSSQKEQAGGVSADIVITLLNLLKSKSKEIFEETVYALKKIDMPEFIHTLYLYTAGAVSILSLKPAQKGLYELSETLHYLLGEKSLVVMAVNGDSGTGKTYFCQSLLDGFGNLKRRDILYLMRDRKRDQKIFNRILGLKWLKKHIDPPIYEDYPLSEDEDNPEEYFDQFFEANSDKRLIILDGCRDRWYFQKVIDLFYFRGHLDIEVNFRSTFSTRRQNLEEREIALESIKTHLSFLEEPAVEDTYYYQEDFSFVYDLDNSITSRLSMADTQELFMKKKIDSWGDLVRVGDFEGPFHTAAVKKSNISSENGSFSLKDETWPPVTKTAFRPLEKKCKPVLNSDLEKEPHLLQTITDVDLNPVRIAFYAQNQIAGICREGTVFILSFIDNRFFYHPMPGRKELTAMGRDLFLTGTKGELSRLSFETTELTQFQNLPSPVTASAAFPRERMVTGHEDGSIRLWNFEEKTIHVFSAHRHPVNALAVDYHDRIYSSSSDGSICRWDPDTGRRVMVRFPEEFFSRLTMYRDGKILAVASKTAATKNDPGSESHHIIILDFNRLNKTSVFFPFKQKILNLCMYADGRILAAAAGKEDGKAVQGNNLIVFSPQELSGRCFVLPGFLRETADVLTLGPKILTCGSDFPGEYFLRIWGTSFYVRNEAAKISIFPSLR